MLLAIDVGNTRTKVGLWDGAQWIRIEVAPSTDEGVQSLTRTGIFEGVENVFGSTVVPKLKDVFLAKAHVPLRNWLDGYFGFGDLETVIKYEPEQALGSDRFANAMGAYARSKLRAAIAVDLGTATKIDVMSDEDYRTYHGGTILPGLGMSITALEKGTALLPSVELSLPPSAIATNTKDSIRSGILFGHAAAIDGLIEKMQQDLGRAVDVFVTGGYAELIRPLCRTQMVHVPRLTLNGLVAIDWVLGTDISKGMPAPDQD